MSSTEPEKLFARGLAAFKSNDTLSALVLFEKACQLDYNPGFVSYLAFCLAKERGQYKKAIALCKESVEKEPANQAHYLNLGRIHVLMGNKPMPFWHSGKGFPTATVPSFQTTWKGLARARNLSFRF